MTADAVDHVIVGAGVSGVLLARRLLQDHPRAGSGRPRLLVIDPALADDRRETLAHWTTAPTPVDRWALRTWDRLEVVGHDDRARRVALDGFRYTALSWGRARVELLAELAGDPRVTLLGRAVDDVEDVGDGRHEAHVRVGGEWIPGRWVYDSRPPGIPSDLGSARSIRLYQTFRGVWVRTDVPVLDPSTATLLDFSADDGPELGFAYVLPVTARSAMVMAVRMAGSTQLPDPIPAVPRQLGEHGWRVVGEERGVTPLISPPAPRRVGRRILAIGRRGGRVRPSTGYALARILTDTEAIAASLRQHRHPFAIPPDPWRDRTLDAIWLHALARERADLEPAFLAMFRDVPIGSVLRFLNGGAGAADLARVIAALPPTPFLRAAARLALARPSPVEQDRAARFRRP